SRDHLDTTIIDILLMRAYSNIGEGDLLAAKHVLSLVERLLREEEALVRLRKLYQIGFTSSHAPPRLS
ncbi:MAG: hypothetical protein ABWK01_06815, partial [Infirmifilum sp.]